MNETYYMILIMMQCVVIGFVIYGCLDSYNEYHKKY